MEKLPTPEEHSKNFIGICEQMNILHQTSYGLQSLSSACNMIGLEKLSSDLFHRANTIEEVMDTTLKLVKKYQHEELLMVSYEVDLIKQALKK